MFKYFNKASKILSNYFKHDESMDMQNSIIEDSVIYLNSQIILWKRDLSIDDDNFNQLFSFRFNNKFMIYNLLNRKIEFKNNSDKLIDFKTPEHPSYTLEFLLTFAISAKNWLSLDYYNILIVHDDLLNPKVLSILCTILSYVNQNLIHPMDLYANIISTNKAFAELANISLYKNVTRYINYFSMLQTNPIVEYKKMYLKSIILNGAPAIDNEEKNDKSKHYLTINEKSYYKPVIRILSNDKICFSSYKKDHTLSPIYYSADNCAKFDVSTLLFGDTVIEILHFSDKENKFKQLFLIQFHTFFISENGIRFTRDQIDGICKDIRYPDEFFVDLIFDNSKSTTISTYEENVSKWKNIISDFILKSYKTSSNVIPNESKDSNIVVEHERFQSQCENLHETDKDEDMIIKPSTQNKAQEILQKFSVNQDLDNEDDEDEEEEDIENYLKNLENKTK